MNQRTLVLTRSLDRIHARIAAGDASGGVLQLACMLDTALIDRAEIAQFKPMLHSHPIADCLGSARVREAIAQLDPLRALAGREQQLRGETEQAWRRGLTCLLVGPLAGRGLDRLAGRDLSNIAQCAGAGELDSLPAADRFDLILAPDLADTAAPDVLADRLTDLAARLRPGGRLVLAAFVAEHAGHGWRDMFFVPPIHSHAPQAIAAAARSAGLSARLFEDATGCLVWAELRPAVGADHPGGER